MRSPVRVERNSVQAESQVDLVTVPADVGILERHMVGLGRLSPVAAASRMTADAKLEELRQTRDAAILRASSDVNRPCARLQPALCKSSPQ
jgi:hypothetical protein